MEENIFQCPRCGNICSSKDYDETGTNHVCHKCTNTWRDEKKYETFVSDLAEADILFDSAIPDFVRAFEKYNSLCKHLPENANAHWKKFLSKRFVKLQADAEGVLHPTYFGSSYEPIDGDVDLLNAYKYADDEKRKEYKRIAGEIDKASEKINELHQNPHKFDLFISFKSGTDKNHKSEDEKYAEILYEELTKLNRNVFFSNKLNQIYDGSEAPSEAIIYDALMNSTGFVIVTSTSDCFTKDSWVKNEWERFLYKMTHDPDKDKRYYFDCVSTDRAVYRELPPSIRTVTDSKNFIVIDKDKPDSFVGIINERLNKYVGHGITISDSPKIRIDRDRTRVKKNVTKALGNDKKPIIKINIDRSEEENARPQVYLDKDNIRILLNTAFEDLSSGTRFLAAKNAFIEVCKLHPSNARAQFGLLLAKEEVKDIIDLTDEALKKFKDGDYAVLKQAIFYYSSDDKLQIDIKKEDRVEAKILKRLSLFVKECIKNPKLYDFDSCILAIECILPFRENDFVKEFVDEIFVAFDDCKKIPDDDSYFDFVKALLSCTSNESYLNKLQKIIRSSINHNAKGLISRLLEYYLSLCKEEDGFYLDSKIRYEHNLKEFDDFVLYLLENNEIDKLEKIVDSLPEKEGKVYLSKLCDLLEEEFGKCKNKLNHVGELAKFIFQYQFDNRNKVLEDFVTYKLSSSPIMECNQLMVELVVPNFDDDDEAYLLGLRYTYLCENKKEKFALDFVRSASKENPGVFKYHEWELNLLLKTDDASKSVNIEDIINFDKNNGSLVFMSSIADESKNRLELTDKTDAIVKNICFECVNSLKKYKSKADVVIGYFNYFVKFISSKKRLLRCECFKYVVEECLKNKIFNITINKMNVLENYCRDLITYSARLVDKGEYVEDIVEYYIYLMQVVNKARTKLDLINIPRNIQTECDEYSQLLKLSEQDNRYKKQVEEFRELVVIPQSKILGRR